MIEIPRLLARQLWAVLRRCVPRAHGLRPAHVEFQTGPAGLTVRLAQPEIAVEYRQPGAYPPAALGLPLSALARFEGRGQDLVALEAGKDGPVIARWQDGGIPQMVEYTADADTRPRDFPDVPSEFVRNPPALLHALDEASKTTATEGVRFALHCLQLRGRSGEVVATDGKQLLLQGGFQFPWQEDLLIPRLAAFGCKELATDQPVEVGRQNDRVVLRSGCWTFFLHIDADARYPQADQVIPKLRDRTTTWRIAAEDAVFLARALPRLPGGEEDDKPLTVDLNGSVCVRARSAGQGRPTEVVLARSSFEGQPVRFAINRQFLGRILQLGFDELSLFGADRAVLAQDNQRTLVVMPLPKEAALACQLAQYPRNQAAHQPEGCHVDERIAPEPRRFARRGKRDSKLVGPRTAEQVDKVYHILAASYTGPQEERRSILSSEEADNPIQGEEGYTPEEIDRRQLINRQIRERRGQAQFRNALRDRFGDRCLVTGCAALAVLEAAHIYPYRGEDDNHPENGLLLRSDIHTLFDLNLLGIEPVQLRVKLHPSVAAEYGHLAEGVLGCPENVCPSRRALTLRYEQFLYALRVVS